ncbi:hypothetical protein ACIHEI_29820 [Kitasatospora sp. NPDC051984]|uniref:hypothetical protein n=1 Tax=Kitasatospora sp. NPDC051984 TaxID=3364059 RepID=UPI0037C5DA6C
MSISTVAHTDGSIAAGAAGATAAGGAATVVDGVRVGRGWTATGWGASTAAGVGAGACEAGFGLTCGD